MQYIVHTPNSAAFLITSKMLTIEQLKEKIQNKSGIHQNQQMLFSNGKILKNDNQLCDNDIIHVSLRLFAG